MSDPEEPFYLRDIVVWPCGGVMLPTIRMEIRFYQCGCGRRVDAIALETEVWQRVSALRPGVCHPSPPDVLRHALLTTVLRRIELGPRGVAFRLRWQPPGAALDRRSRTRDDQPHQPGAVATASDTKATTADGPRARSPPRTIATRCTA